MRRFVLVMVLASTGFFLAGTQPVAQAADAWIGTWTLNLAQSSYDPANLAPKNQTTKIAASGDSNTVVTDGVDAQNKKTHTEITYKFDGREYELKGAPDAKTTRVYTRVDEHAYSYATKVAGQNTTNSRVAVTPDGKTRTIVTTGRDAQGRTIRNFSVWNRSSQ